MENPLFTERFPLQVVDEEAGELQRRKQRCNDKGRLIKQQITHGQHEGFKSRFYKVSPVKTVKTESRKSH